MQSAVIGIMTLATALVGVAAPVAQDTAYAVELKIDGYLCGY